MSKKNFLGVVILIVVVIFCVGCGSDTATEEAASSEINAENVAENNENTETASPVPESVPETAQTESVVESGATTADPATNAAETENAVAPANGTENVTTEPDNAESAPAGGTDVNAPETPASTELPQTASQPTVTEGQGKYEQITQEKAKEIIDAEEPAVILDVRTHEEYNQGHIDGALCIPVESLSGSGKAVIEQLIPRKDQFILVYCRSGNRSQTAAQLLADMGYTNVKEFGGINDWQYGTVTE